MKMYLLLKIVIFHCHVAFSGVYSSVIWVFLMQGCGKESLEIAQYTLMAQG